MYADVHVLLVKDNPSDVLLIREAIRTSTIPADVIVAYAGAQALRLLREFQFKPDVIALDISLPKLGVQNLTTKPASAVVSLLALKQLGNRNARNPFTAIRMDGFWCGLQGV